ncbi:MAG: IspD/TarI family cytidylyltransferase, partial [Longimicrobiales bacterium]
PQAFPRGPLERAMDACRAAGEVPTDDAAAFEFGGGSVQMVQASPHNLKVTYPADLKIAQLLVDEGLV